MRRVVLTLFSAIGLVLAATATAAASPPTHQPPETVTFEATASCGGFDDQFQGHFTVRTTIFHDSAGNDLIETDHVQQRETDTNSVTGKTIRAKESFTFRENLKTGVVTYTGQVWIALGKGANVIHDTGKLVLDENGDVLKLAGPHTVFFGGNEPFCDALR